MSRRRLSKRPLSKRDAETLLRDFDADPVAALTVALRIVLQLPDATWEELLAACDLADDRRRALADRAPDALDRFAMDLNEERGSSL